MIHQYRYVNDIFSVIEIKMTFNFVFIEDKPEDYGKQKCWSSFGWGGFSIFIGWLVDRFSVGKKEKDYSPVFYSCILLTICNLFVINKLKVSNYFLALTYTL